MVDDLHALGKRNRILGVSQRSDLSTSTDESDSCEDGAISTSPLPQVRSRKQNIRELREEFEDYPELYGIRRSARSRKEPVRFKPNRISTDLSFTHKRRRLHLNSSSSNELTESEEDWNENVSSRHRTVRTRGNRVNYKDAFIDDSPTESGSDPSDRSNSTISKSYNYRTSNNVQLSQQTGFQKPRGSLIRKSNAPNVSSDKRRTKSTIDDFERVELTDHLSDEEYGVEQNLDKSEWGDDEADVIEEVVTHTTRRKGATGNSTTFYNCRLEKDPNANFDPDAEAGEVHYLIKWRNWSYIHSTWETESSLRSPERGVPVVGMKKFFAYQASIREKNEFLRFAERDELEAVAYEEDRNEEILQEKMNVERIVAHSRDPETNTFDYLIKWFRLDYRLCSWESGRVIHALYASAVSEYEERCRSTKLPNNKCEVLHTRPRFSPLTVQPGYLGKPTECVLRDYQLEGINWMIRAWTRGNSVILADEMGLGKTIQTISFLSYLFHEYSLYGPFLIVVPLSTVSSWQTELTRWAPDMNTIIYIGDHVSRQLIREHEWSAQSGNNMRRQQSLKFNVCVTTYEILLKDKSWLGQVNWAFLGVDEAHRLKNDSSQLYKTLSTFNTNTRLLITGTPLQNTMKELWALLHFAMPDIFECWNEFEETYGVAADDPTNRVNGEAFHNLHKALKPFLLRRVKKDVESSLPEKIEQILRVDMTKEQANIYRLILARNYDGLMKVTRGHKASFVNIVMELKKCCNHAHLIAPPSENDSRTMTRDQRVQSFIRGSGKACLLDKLLQRLRSKGHRVLIFSQMVRLLDLIADYLYLRAWGFQRLDGSIRGELRKQALDHFNAEGSTDFCFLLSTRAGGLGINLATADTVIIFDSDWNPQNDLQAQARAHRIGQTKQVSVYRLVTRDSVEEKIIESATRKMVLDHLVIQRMDSGGGRGKRGDASRGQLLTEILRYGAEGLFKQRDDEVADLDLDIDDILNRAETRDTDATIESNPANALLSSFKVVNLDSLDDDVRNNENDEKNAKVGKTWDEIIPNDLRGQIKDEEARRTLVGLELGPRRRRQVKAYQAGIDVNQSSDEPSENELDGKISSTQLNEKEIRALVRAIRRFAHPLERIDAIAADAELPDRSESEIKAVVDAVLKGCKAVMQNTVSNQFDETSKSVQGGKGPIFRYGRVNVAARPLLQSLEYLEILHQCFPNEGKEARMSYDLPFLPKLVAWSCPWDSSDDVRLLAGVYEHGYDNWDAIKLDADLGLGSKLLPVSQTERPQASHLRSRVDYLLKMLAKNQNTSSVIEHNSLKKKRRPETDSNRVVAKNKERSSFSRGNTKSISKPTSNVNIVTSNPKSAEFVETDDSSDSDEEAAPELPSKRPKKTDSKLKVKQRINTSIKKENNTTNVDPNSHPNTDATGVLGLTTTEEEDFRNMRGPLFMKCKEKLLPIKKHFKQLEHLEDTKDEDPKQFSKVMLRIGDHIHSVVQEFSDKNKRHAWKSYLWEFVHIFSKKNTEELRQIYRHAVKRRSKEAEKQQHTNNMTQSPKHHKDHDQQKERSHDAHGRYTSSSYHNDSDSRRFSHYENRPRDGNDRRDHYVHVSSYKYVSNAFTNDWASVRSHKDFNRDKNDARFNNAFNRLPGHSGPSHPAPKHYHKDRGFISHAHTTVPFQNRVSPGLHSYSGTPKASDATLHSPPKLDNTIDYSTSFFPLSEKSVSNAHIPAPHVIPPVETSYHNQYNRDPRLTSLRR